MIWVLNLKNPLKVKSDDSRKKEDMKRYFQDLLEKSTSFIYSKKSNPYNLCLTQDPFILENFPKTGKFKFTKVQLLQRR